MGALVQGCSFSKKFLDTNTSFLIDGDYLRCRVLVELKRKDREPVLKDLLLHIKSIESCVPYFAPYEGNEYESPVEEESPAIIVRTTSGEEHVVMLTMNHMLSVLAYHHPSCG